MEPKEDVMSRRPDKRGESIVSRSLLKLLFFRAPVMAAGILVLFFYELANGKPLIYAQTMAFTTLALAQWLNGLNCRSEKKSIFRMPFFGNKYLIIGLTAAVLLQLALLYLPFFQGIFSVAPLGLDSWAKIIAFGSAVFWAEEIRKFLAARKSKN